MRSPRRRAADGDSTATETRHFFHTDIILAEAPVTLLKELYSIDATAAAPAPASPELDSRNAIDPADRTVASAADLAAEADAECEQELFMTGVESKHLRRLLDLLGHWEQSGSDEFWRLLNVTIRTDTGGGSRRSSVRMVIGPSDMDMSAKCLVAILHRCITDTMQGRRAIVDGIVAAQSFLSLLRLPGSDAYYHIFSVVILHDILALLRQSPAELCTASGATDAVNEPESDEDDLPEFEQLTVRPKKPTIVNEPKECCQSFLAFLLHLKSSLNSCQWITDRAELIEETMIPALVESTQMSGLDMPTAGDLKELIHLTEDAAYDCLYAICSTDRYCLKILHALLPALCMKGDALGSSKAKLLRCSSRAAQFIAQQAAADIHEMHLYILVQQIAINTAEKADARAQSSSVIVELCHHLSKEMRSRFAKWLIILGNNPRNGHRQMAVESMSAIIAAWSASSTDHDDYFDNTVLGVISHSYLNHINDKSPGCRSKTLASLTDLFALEARSGVCHQQLVYQRNQLNASLLGDMLDALLARISDEKFAVRKCAIALGFQLLHWNYLADTNSIAEVNVERMMVSLETRARDATPTIRKLVLQEFTKLLLAFPAVENLWRVWKECVFMSARDNESSVQMECAASFKSVILANLEDTAIADVMRNWIWKYFTPVPAHNWATTCNFVALAKSSGGVAVRQIDYLQDLALADLSNEGAWSLLAVLATSVDDMSMKLLPVVNLWENISANSESPILLDYLRIILSIAGKLPEINRERLRIDMVKKLGRMNFTKSCIPLIVTLLHNFNGPNETEWCRQLMQRFVVLLEEQKERSATDACIALFALGELGTVCPLLLSESVLRPVLLRAAEQSDVDNSISAQAIITLGKFFLMKEEWAKKHSSLLAREVEQSRHNLIRNNAMVALCDICRRYAQIVDQYVPVIANCLVDEYPLVRIQCLLAMTKLFQEDYIKWKGTLFLKFLVATVDDEAYIAEVARTSLEQMGRKHPQLFFANFVDVIYQLNDGRGHITDHTRLRKSFTMTGSDNSIRRNEIYTFMLQRLEDEQRFLLTRKLCVDLLKKASDSHIDIESESGSNILTDAFSILCSKDIKSSLKVPKSDCDDEEEADTARQKLVVISSKIHSQISRKLAIENIIPIIIELKHLFELKRSPLLKNLMLCLREIVKDFRVEMEDVMASDRQLAQEIEFDLRQYEAENQHNAENCDTTIASKPSFKTPFPKLKALQSSTSAVSLSKIIKTPVRPSSASVIQPPQSGASERTPLNLVQNGQRTPAAVTPLNKQSGTKVSSWSVQSPAVNCITRSTRSKRQLAE